MFISISKFIRDNSNAFMGYGGVFVICLLIAFLNLSGGFWIGGDTVPNFTLFNFSIHNIGFHSSQFGISGVANGLSFFGFIPLGFLFKILALIFHNFTDTIIFAGFLWLFLVGYFLFFQSIRIPKFISGLLSLALLVSPYAWMMINRNVIFLLVLLLTIPYISLTIQSVIEHGGKNNWFKFFVVAIFLVPGSLVNPGYAIPAVLLVFAYIYSFVDWKQKKLSWFIILTTLAVVALPTLIGQIHLLRNSTALQDDYWNNVVLTQIPLIRQKTTNTFDNVIRGFNSDTLGSYGYFAGADYYPWWFTPYKDKPVSTVLYIPFFMALLLTGYVFITSQQRKMSIFIFIIIALLFVFFMKSSAGWGGDQFAQSMMKYGWLKMFRSPHTKFGFEFMLSLFILIGLSYNLIQKKYLQYFIIGALSIYLCWGMYPLVHGFYIPQMQKASAIPSDYFEVVQYLKNVKIQTGDDLGILLPPNDSTWDSNNWGYEGYHILHWLNTGISFLNRNGLAFNAKNIDGFNYLINLSKNGSFDKKSEQALRGLKAEGYDVIVYDRTSDRTNRFNVPEYHDKNIAWLNTQKQVEKVFESTHKLLVVYRLK